MKLSANNLLALAGSLAASNALTNYPTMFHNPSLEIYERYITPEQVRKLDAAPIDIDSHARFYGITVLEKDIADSLPRDRDDCNKAVDTPILKQVLTETTHRHQDYYVPFEDKAGQLVDGKAGFFVLNTNPDAYFHHGDIRVPIEAGKFVKFDGRIMHNTVINSGEVRLAGPFEIDEAGIVMVGLLLASVDKATVCDLDSVESGCGNGSQCVPFADKGVCVCDEDDGELDGCLTTNAFKHFKAKARALNLLADKRKEMMGTLQSE